VQVFVGLINAALLLRVANANQFSDAEHLAGRPRRPASPEAVDSAEVQINLVELAPALSWSRAADWRPRHVDGKLIHGGLRLRCRVRLSLPWGAGLGTTMPKAVDGAHTPRSRAACGHRSVPGGSR